MKWKYFSWMNLAEGNILLFPVHIQIVFQQTIVFISIQYYSITLCKVEYSTRFWGGGSCMFIRQALDYSSELGM